MQIQFILNGNRVQTEVEGSDRLIDVLRDRFGMTSVKEGCSEGECGACTVIMDGRAVTSCSVLGFQADGSEIVTLEGLDSEGTLNPLQSAFIEAGAVQCGFCTPGMIMSAKALLDQSPSPTEDEIRRGISGNLCRCTGYHQIINAVKIASKESEGHE